MDKGIFTEIHERNKAISEFCDHYGITEKDIPEDLLNEIWGGPRGAAAFDDDDDLRAGRGAGIEREYRGEKPGDFRPSFIRSREGGPRAFQPGPGVGAGPQVGEYLFVQGKPRAITDVQTKFGEPMIRVEGYPRWIVASNLQVDRKVGGKNIYVSPQHK